MEQGVNLKVSRYFWFILTFIYMSGILWFSTKPGVDKHSGHYSVAMEYFKNFLHFPAYGGLAFLWIQTFNSVKNKALLATFLIAASWGIFNEFVQAHIPNRYFSIDDMIVNALGALLVIALARKGIIAVVS